MGRPSSLARGCTKPSRILRSMLPICGPKHSSACRWRTDNSIYPTGDPKPTPILLSRADWEETRSDNWCQYWDVLCFPTPSNLLRLVHHSHPALAISVNVCLEGELPSFQNRDLDWIGSSFWPIHRRSFWTPHPCLTRSSYLLLVRLLRKTGRMT